MHITLVGFVDDVTGQTNNFYNENVTPARLIHLMQEDAQVWSDLLWLTGGLLELDKCSYHFIWYQFLQDGTPVMQSTRPGPPLIVQQSHNKTNTKIKYKNKSNCMPAFYPIVLVLLFAPAGMALPRPPPPREQ